MERSAPKMQGEARSAEFQRHAKIAKDLAGLAEHDIDEALIENQINMMGIDAGQALLDMEQQG